MQSRIEWGANMNKICRYQRVSYVLIWALLSFSRYIWVTLTHKYIDNRVWLRECLELKFDSCRLKVTALKCLVNTN